MQQRHIKRRDLVLGLAAGSIAALAPDTRAQTSADLVTILTGFPAGAAPDVVARRVGEKLAGSYARAVVVDSKTGAGGQIAVTATRNAVADGSQVLLTPMSMMCVYPHTYRKLPYDAMADFAPVSMAITHEYGIGVGPSVPASVTDIRGLLNWFKANPKQANIASPATGSTLHFVSVLLGRSADVPVTHVGYRGSGPAILDMLGGSLAALCAPLGSFLNQPQLRVLATSGAQRSRFMPQVPTLAEQSFKDMVYHEWYGFFVPKKTPPERVDRLSAAVRSALQAPDVVEALHTIGLEPAPSSPDVLSRAMVADTARWGAIIKSIGFSAD